VLVQALLIRRIVPRLGERWSVLRCAAVLAARVTQMPRPALAAVD
jgi:hypothetical protein